MSIGNRNGNGNGNGNGHDPAGPVIYGASGAGGDQPFRHPVGPPAFVPRSDLEPEGLTLRDYMGVIWRRKWIIFLILVVATASAYYFSSRQEKRYTTSGTMFYKQQIDLSNPLTGGYTDTLGLDREMATIGDLMAGPDLQGRAAAVLKQADADTSAGFAITAGQQSSSSTTDSSDGGSNVVVVSADSPDPKLAAAAVNAYMAAFVAWDAEQWRDQIHKALPVIEGQLGEYRGKAAKLTSDYVLLKQRYQDLLILEKTTDGSYRVLMPASVPAAPYAPKPLRSAILGFAVGLFAGIGLAFLLEQFNTAIRKPDEIAAILRLPVLGRVPKIANKLLHENLPVALSHPDGHIAEAFRMVRTNLDFTAVDSDVTSIAITSALKGEGKSVGLANLAVTMALAGKKVVVVDADLRRPRQHRLFDLANEVGVSTVTAGTSTLHDSLVPVELVSKQSRSSGDFDEWAKGADSRARLYVLPSGPVPPNPGEIVASRRFAGIIKALETEADVVLVDTPAMLAVGDTSAIASRVDGLVFLVDMHMIKKPQLATAADQLRRLPTALLGVVVRMTGRRSEGYYTPGDYYRYAPAETGAARERRRSAGRRATDQVEV